MHAAEKMYVQSWMHTVAINLFAYYVSTLGGTNKIRKYKGNHKPFLD